MENTQMTLGQKRVQRNFNPSANSKVEKIKQMYADIIDYLDTLRNELNGREISIAQTESETACMYAVKSQFVIQNLPTKTKSEIYEEYAKLVHTLYCKDKNQGYVHVHKPQIEGIVFTIFEGRNGSEFHYLYYNEKGQEIKKQL